MKLNKAYFTIQQSGTNILPAKPMLQDHTHFCEGLDMT